MTKLRLLCFLPLAACADTNGVVIDLAPEVISSIDGTLSVHTTVLADRDPVDGQAIDITVDYTDRNGTPHTISPVSGKSDKNGAFDTTFTGLTWDGTGTVKASVAAGKYEASASFAVLDRTPPKATIMPPANNTVRVNTDATIQVHVTDEIGISQVWFEWNGQFARERTSVVASGSADATLSFDVPVPDFAQVGSMITFYALVADLSGNEAAAAPITVTVTQ